MQMQIESKPLHKFGKVLTKFRTAFINSRESRKFIYISIAIECASSLKHSENLSQHIEKTWFSYWIWFAERQIRQKLFEIATYFCQSTKCCVNEKFWIFKESVIKLQQRLFLCIGRHHVKSVEKCSTPECTPNEKLVQQEGAKGKKVSVQFQKKNLVVTSTVRYARIAYGDQTCFHFIDIFLLCSAVRCVWRKLCVKKIHTTFRIDFSILLSDTDEIAERWEKKTKFRVEIVNKEIMKYELDINEPELLGETSQQNDRMEILYM